MTVGIGIFGAGSIARVHAQALKDLGHQVVGFYDIDADKAADAAAAFGAKAWSDSEAMLSSDDVTAVVVAVPNLYHAPLAMQAMEAGCDVLLEKPMAMSSDQCDEVIATRDRTGRTLQIGFVCRFAAPVVAARRHIAAGRLGKIYQSRAVMLRRRGIPGLGRWFTDKATSGGGVLIDLGPHLVDLILHLTDRPAVERVSAATSSCFGAPAYEYKFTDMWAGPPNPDGVFDVDDGAAAMLRCAGGMTVTLETAWASHLPDGTIADGVTLFGERGSMHFDIWGNSVLIGTQLDGEIVDVTHPIPDGEGWGTAFQREHACFNANCSSPSASGPPAEDGRDVQRVLEAMYRSAESGQECAV